VAQRRIEAVARFVGHHQGAEFGQGRACDLVICDDNHTSGSPRPERRRHRVAGQGKRELAPARAGQRGEPGFGLGEYLDGHQH
jgi:hypothetical protein